MVRSTAPAALAAGAALFLVCIWPFWPALVRLPQGFFAEGDAPARRLAGGVLRSALELVMLAGLAAPFAVVAWSVGGWPVEGGPALVAAAGLAAVGLGLRIALAGMAPAAGRWLMAAAMLVAAGPLLAAYAANETLGTTLPAWLELSPVYTTAEMLADGWPPEGWAFTCRVWLWPGVGAALAAAGMLESRRRRRQEGRTE
jgi:hypothetical protein